MNESYYSLAKQEGLNYRETGNFKTYAETYEAMVNAYMDEKQRGVEPTLWMILKHSISNYGGTYNEMVAPAFS